MEFKNLKIIIPTCDKYMHAVEGLMYTLNKYFNISNKIILIGYSEPKFIRPEELKYLKGDSTKARTILGWEPEYTFETLMDDMIDGWFKLLDK